MTDNNGNGITAALSKKKEIAQGWIIAILAPVVLNTIMITGWLYETRFTSINNKERIEQLADLLGRNHAEQVSNLVTMRRDYDDKIERIPRIEERIIALDRRIDRLEQLTDYIYNNNDDRKGGRRLNDRIAPDPGIWGPRSREWLRRAALGDTYGLLDIPRSNQPSRGDVGPPRSPGATSIE